MADPLRPTSPATRRARPAARARTATAVGSAIALVGLVVGMEMTASGASTPATTTAGADSGQAAPSVGGTPSQPDDSTAQPGSDAPSDAPSYGEPYGRHRRFGGGGFATPAAPSQPGQQPSTSSRGS